MRFYQRQNIDEELLQGGHEAQELLDFIMMEYQTFNMIELEFFHNFPLKLCDVINKDLKFLEEIIKCPLIYYQKIIIMKFSSKHCCYC